MAVESDASDAPVAARILICGDHPVICTALRRLIDAEPGMTVIGECSNQCCSLSEEVAARPDLILMDLDLDTRCSGALEQLGELLGAANGAPILILTARVDARSLQCALQHGASGVVMKQRPAWVLVRAIHTVLSGEMWLERATMAGMFRAELPPSAVAHEKGMAEPDKLTRREWEIIELIRLGLQNKRIAERLFISETTVRHHFTSIFDKLGVANRCELMSYVFGHDRALAAAPGQR